MNNSPSANSNNVDSPKTPAGISKSFLIRCKRPGLSRNWKKDGSSPFKSPLVRSVDTSEEVESKKRKVCVLNEHDNKTPESIAVKSDELCNKIVDSISTPSRSLDLPRRKRSKILLSAINEDQDTVDSKITAQESISAHSGNVSNKNGKSLEKSISDVNSIVKTPLRTKSGKNNSLTCNIISKTNKEDRFKELEDISKDVVKPVHTNVVKENDNQKIKVREQSPSDLKKNCIVVLQKEIFKDVAFEIDKTKNSNNLVITQPVFTADADDIPLSKIRKENSKDLIKNNDINLEAKENNKKIDKSSQKLKANSKIIKTDPVTSQTVLNNVTILESFDDDDDDFDNTKNNILIKKQQAKVSKPSKAKSTGSITQKDIDELKARIKVKKRLLLTKVMTEDTKELRDLIKKWQKGCQDALTELMDLMKSKFPDKANMDYSEILQTLKIPATLVGYNSEEDCFITPDDNNIILGNL